MLLTLLARPGAADQIRLVNGDNIQGWGIALTQGVLYLSSPVLGGISIPKEKVSHLSTQWPVWVVFTNKKLVRGTIVTVGPGQMAVDQGEVGRTAPFGMAELESIAAGETDPLALRRQWKTSGGINLGSTVATGNVESEYLHADGNISLRQEDNRYTARGEANYRKERKSETENNARLSLKHDDFFTDRWFFYTTGSVGYDKGRSLNLHTDIGSGTGYQIFETDRTKLSVEGGLSFVVEDYSEGQDNSYPAARWSTDFQYDPWIKKVRLFHFHEILADLEGENGVTARTRTGLRYFVTEGLNATGQINFDWDSDPAPGKREGDVVYLITLGYAW